MIWSVSTLLRRSTLTGPRIFVILFMSGSVRNYGRAQASENQAWQGRRGEGDAPASSSPEDAARRRFAAASVRAWLRSGPLIVAADGDVLGGDGLDRLFLL